MDRGFLSAVNPNGALLPSVSRKPFSSWLRSGPVGSGSLEASHKSPCPALLRSQYGEINLWTLGAAWVSRVASRVPGRAGTRERGRKPHRAGAAPARGTPIPRFFSSAEPARCTFRGVSRVPAQPGTLEKGWVSRRPSRVQVSRGPARGVFKEPRPFAQCQLVGRLSVKRPWLLVLVRL